MIHQSCFTSFAGVTIVAIENSKMRIIIQANGNDDSEHDPLVLTTTPNIETTPTTTVSSASATADAVFPTATAENPNGC